jgi:hypothetical protein
MPSAVWSGHLHFGLVVMPVRLLVAARPKTTRFRRLSRRPGNHVVPPMQLPSSKQSLEDEDSYSDGAVEPGVDTHNRESSVRGTQYDYDRVRQVLRSEVTGEVVRPGELVKGYEVARNEFAAIDPQEIKAAEVETSDTIDLFHFVNGANVDPIYFERSYYERNDWPTAWTADSRAVLFWSDRNGSSQVFKQNIDQETPETVVAGPEEDWMPRVSPDGTSILYLANPQGFNNPSKVRLMRVQSNGGPAQLVMGVPRLGNYACARPPSDVCFLAQVSEDGEKHIFSAFDPLQGKPHQVLTLDVHHGGPFNWMPSPDGSRIAFMATTPWRAVSACSPSRESQSATSSSRDGLDSIPWTGRRTPSRSSFPVSHPPVRPCCAWT